MPVLKTPKKIKIPAPESKPIGLAEGTKELLKELEERRKTRDQSVNK